MKPDIPPPLLTEPTIAMRRVPLAGSVLRAAVTGRGRDVHAHLVQGGEAGLDRVAGGLVPAATVIGDVDGGDVVLGLVGDDPLEGVGDAGLVVLPQRDDLGAGSDAGVVLALVVERAGRGHPRRACAVGEVIGERIGVLALVVVPGNDLLAPPAAERGWL